MCAKDSLFGTEAEARVKICGSSFLNSKEFSSGHGRGHTIQAKYQFTWPGGLGITFPIIKDNRKWHYSTCSNKDTPNQFQKSLLTIAISNDFVNNKGNHNHKFI